MAAQPPEIDELLDRAGHGDGTARDQLLAYYRQRLRKMVAFRLDRRLAARVDPSDVVQEVLAKAAQKMADYLEHRPVPFYPWLRSLAWERLVEVHRWHLRSRKRSVGREAVAALDLPEGSVLELAGRLVASATSPSQRVVRQELRQRVRAALAQLPATDSEVLVLRHLEELTTAETAAVLGIAEGAVKMRHLRALERLRDSLKNHFAEDE
jgi:RNA polymerase sigma-70 factor (ECF subfamily)